ncbi:serine/threonine-protein kinase PEPKR2-like [Tasmannia lanceolata]|uniref:serine/threonine-protein kinase PEPKR2-like n=1 Tax=Tasmannia lanceolata TaxID=3420 RepID=UPI0040627F1A
MLITLSLLMFRQSRKGSDSPVRSDLSSSIMGPNLLFEDCQNQKQAEGSAKSRLIGITTAHPCGNSPYDLRGRGLKRKLGCIESATQMGRKKKLEKEYILGHKIGEGKFGSVRLCRSMSNGAEFACKTLTKMGEETPHREVEIMQHLSGHPNVVTLEAVYEDSESFHLVMELCSGGRFLDDMIKTRRYSEHRAANLLKEQILVIKYCHDMGVDHRDIKPENILLSTSGNTYKARQSRKGSDSPVRSDLSSSIMGPNLLFEDCSRLMKKCQNQKQEEGSAKSRLIGIPSAHPCGNSPYDLRGRGLKRKLGCIESATQMGRKKKLEKEYILGHKIGEGKFGSVRLCRSKSNGAEFACKTLTKMGKETPHMEVEIMQHLSGHPSVVTLEAVYEDSESFHLVMELCSGGRFLDEMIKTRRYSEHRAANLLKELILVIKYCHDMGVIHRDIKPENILLSTSGKLKLADFGLSKRFSDGQRVSGLAGSPAYLAPEVIVGHYSEKVDIWSAGVLLHAMLVGVLPFQGDSQEAMFEAIKNVKLDFDTGLWDSISKPARDLIGQMLTRDVSMRLTTDQVLRHPWIVFHTEQLFKTQTVKTKVRDHGELSSQVAITPAVELKRITVTNTTLPGGVNLFPSLETSSLKLEKQEDRVMVDALAAAISRVGISETKRSRLCGPSSPIRPEFFSNMKANLCTAF